MPQSPNHPQFWHTLPRRHGDMVRAGRRLGRERPDRRPAPTSARTSTRWHTSRMTASCTAASTPRRRGRAAGSSTTACTPSRRWSAAASCSTYRPRSATEVCAPAYEITAGRPATAADRQGVDVGAGDVVLIRSGWGRRFEDGRRAYLGSATGVPGVGEAGAHVAGRARRPRGRRGHASPSNGSRPARGHSAAARPPGAAGRGRHLRHRDAGSRGARRGGCVRVPRSSSRRCPWSAPPVPRCARWRWSPMAEPTLAQQLAGSRPDRRYDGCPTRCATACGKRVLDVARHLRRRDPAGHQPRPRWRSSAGQGGTPQAHAVGMAEPVPAALAAFVNGVLAHSLDYDDTHLPSVLHPSAAVVPAALAAAEACRCRRRRAGRRHRGRARGHGPARHGRVRPGSRQLGVLRTRPARDLDLRGDGRRRAGGAAARRSTRTASRTRSASPPRWPRASSRRTAPAARSSGCTAAGPRTPAVSAAQLARCGFTGPPTVLEGRFGFFQAWLHGHVRPGQVTDGLGTDWAVPGIFFKPYPANHFTHAGDRRGHRAAGAGPPPGRTWSDRARGRRADGAHDRRADRGQAGAGPPATWPSSAARTRSPPACSAAAGSASASTTSPMRWPRTRARRALMAKVDVVADDTCDGDLPAPVPGRRCGSAPRTAVSWSRRS